MTGKTLAGLRVWVTRPAHQADRLCAAIEAAGGHALRQPLLAIDGPRDPRQAVAALMTAQGDDAAVFTSANAVDWAWRLAPDWRAPATLYAVGAATQAALAARSGRGVIAPQRDYSSEGLLAEPGLQAPAGQGIALVSGAGGRGRLARELAARGARLRGIAVYRRRPVAIASARLLALLGEADAIVVTSGEALAHLQRITPPAAAEHLRRLQLVVPSARVVKMAAEFRFQPPLQPQPMEDSAIVDALVEWVAAGNKQGQNT